MEKVAVLGSGAWGNTLAFLLAQNREIILWDHNSSRVRRINKTRRFKKPVTQKYLDSITLSSNIKDVADCDLIVSTVPLKAIAEVFSALQEIQLNKNCVIVNGAKGIEVASLKTPSELIAQFLPENPFAVFSGPNLAKEMIKGKPMIAVVASSNPKTSEFAAEIMSGPTLRIYQSNDVKGVELCAALKNVIAIASGCIDGLELGESAKASLITRGLLEIGVFLEKYGSCQSYEKTLLSPAGMGDLIATCSSNLSRNHRVGFFLAKGKNLDDITSSIGEVAEGIHTCHAVHRICQQENIQLPIFQEIKKLLDNEITAVDAVLNLMSRQGV